MKVFAVKICLVALCYGGDADAQSRCALKMTRKDGAGWCFSTQGAERPAPTPPRASAMRRLPAMLTPNRTEVGVPPCGGASACLSARGTRKSAKRDLMRGRGAGILIQASGPVERARGRRFHDFINGRKPIASMRGLRALLVGRVGAVDLQQGGFVTRDAKAAGRGALQARPRKHRRGCAECHT